MIARRFWPALAAIFITANLSHAQLEDTCSVFRISPSFQDNTRPVGCIAGPVFGFTFDKAGGRLIPILGIAGSLRLDDPIELGFGLEAVHFSDKQSFALGVSSGDRRVISLSFDERLINVRDAGLPSDPGKISISSDGRYGAVLYPSLRQVFVVAQSPEPAIAWIADVSAAPDEITALAISDDGRCLLVATSTGVVYSFAADRAPESAAVLTTPDVVRFLKNSHDAVIADRAERKLYYYSEAAGQTWSFASEAEGVSSPLDLAVSDDNERVFLLNEDSDRIISFSLTMGQSASVACNCVPRQLASLRERTVFAITNVADASLLLFQPTEDGGQILFVPRQLKSDPAY
jgi:hypothetical protein